MAVHESLVDLSDTFVPRNIRNCVIFEVHLTVISIQDLSDEAEFTLRQGERVLEQVPKESLSASIGYEIDLVPLDHGQEVIIPGRSLQCRGTFLQPALKFSVRTLKLAVNSLRFPLGYGQLQSALFNEHLKVVAEQFSDPLFQRVSPYGKMSRRAKDRAEQVDAREVQGAPSHPSEGAAYVFWEQEARQGNSEEKQCQRIPV